MQARVEVEASQGSCGNVDDQQIPVNLEIKVGIGTGGKLVKSVG